MNDETANGMETRDGAAAARPQTARAAKPDPVRRGTNRGVASACVAALVAMGCLSYAAVPLYRMFCQVTGFGGTPQRAEAAPDKVFDRTITVRFDANVTPGMPWVFEPQVRTMDVRVGESHLAFYRATNSSDKPITGTAAFNVSPDDSGAYFSKIECFCFKEQTLQPGESVDMPVSFFIDPKLIENRELDGLRDITLSYTFYPATGSSAAAASAEPSAQQGKGS